MRKHVLMFTTFAFILACGVAVAEETPNMRGPEGHGMMGPLMAAYDEEA